MVLVTGLYDHVREMGGIKGIMGIWTRY